MSIAELTPQLSVAILKSARANAITSRTVSVDFNDTVKASKGTTISINKIKGMTTRPVVPLLTPQAAGMSSIDSDVFPLELDQYEEVAFPIDDRFEQQLAAGTIPEAINMALITLGNFYDRVILDEFKRSIYNLVGTAGTPPFAADLIPAQQAVRSLSLGLAPKDTERFMLLDPFAYANAIGLPQLNSVDRSGSSETLRQGMISQVAGFNWLENQNIPTHTVPTTRSTHVIDGVFPIGAQKINVDNGAGAVTPLATRILSGDVFTIAGSAQQYIVRSINVMPTDLEIEIYPYLKFAPADNAAITILTTTSHTTNFAYHRQAMQVAVRPIQDSSLDNGSKTMGFISDPLTNQIYNWEVLRAYAQNIFRISILFGVKCVRPEFAVRVMG